MKSVGLVVVGSTGVIGQVHIAAIRKLDNCHLVGVYARRQSLLNEQAATLGVKGFSSLKAVFDAPEVDAIVIATPHPSHLEITTQAAEAGKHILVEKPISVTPAEADVMIEICRVNNVKLGVLFNNRFRSEAKRAKALIDDGVVGTVLRTDVASVLFRTQDYYDRLSWRGNWDTEGGGVLINQGIHAIDMMQWLAGMPVRVTGHIGTLAHQIEVEDYATAIFEYSNGGHGTLHCTTALAPNTQRLEVWGNRGVLILNNWGLTVHRLDVELQEFIDTDRTEEFIPPGSTKENFIVDPVADTHVVAIEDFVRAVLQDHKPLISGESARDSQEIVAGIMLSSFLGKRIELPVDRAAYDALLAELRSQ